ncbi:MAG: extracellular solute-binding protein [Bauldia sp.]|nr:extracellular solute-binding protein [Bauldia sp.]
MSRSKSPPLRVLGRGEFLLDPICERARQDLGIAIEFELIDGIESLRRAVTRPDSFDVYHQWHTIDLIWTARTIQPIDLSRIEAAADIRDVALGARGRVRTAVFDRLYLQPDGTLGATPTNRAALLPAIHGVDAFGYLDAARAELAADEPDSWAWLLDERWAGRVAILSDPCLGMIEAALAVEAAEGITFEDIGNLSVDEIDLVAGILIHKKRLGHFKGIWGNYAEAARLMQRSGVVVESIWTPAIARLRGEGIAVRSAVPVEGCRGWHSDLCISRSAKGETLDAAYAYLNWWMNGEAGAILSRQGYYFVLPERARARMSEAEWAYWYEGRPAATALTDPFGRPSIPPGAVREGGSHAERMASARVWNTFMDEHTYLVRRWNEFLAA